MPTTNATIVQQSVQVKISDDRCVAELIVPRGLIRSDINADACLEALRRARIEMTPEVTQAVEQLLAAKPEGDADWRGVVAVGTPAERGLDGEIVWPVTKEVVDETAERVDHYARSAFRVIEQGGTVAEIRSPTGGKDGRDVHGKLIPGIIGDPAEIRFDQTVDRTPDGKLLAKKAGVVIRHEDFVCVRALIEVPGHVDFSVGNIDFNGDVRVKGGVRDRFVIKATGSVSVGELIEAATIECGGTLLSQGGMAGRMQGKISVGGDLIIRYLDQVTGEVRGNLVTDREIANCDLVVHGDVRAQRASIIGGRMTPVSAIAIGTLGSPAGVPTEIHMGRVPALEAKVEQLHASLVELKRQRKLFVTATAELEAKGPSIGDVGREKLDKLYGATDTIDEKMEQVAALCTRLGQQIEQNRKFDLTVGQMICQGTVLFIKDLAYEFRERMSGGAMVTCDATGKPKIGGGRKGGVPLGDLTTVRSADA